MSIQLRILECRSRCNASEEEAELVANTEKGDAGSGRMLGCPPAGSVTSMASRAWAWCAVRSRTQFYREANVLVRYSKGDVSVDGRGGM